MKAKDGSTVRSGDIIVEDSYVPGLTFNFEKVYSQKDFPILIKVVQDMIYQISDHYVYRSAFESIGLKALYRFHVGINYADYHNIGWGTSFILECKGNRLCLVMGVDHGISGTGSTDPLKEPEKAVCLIFTNGKESPKEIDTFVKKLVELAESRPRDRFYKQHGC